MKQRKLFEDQVKELPVIILLFAASVENETLSEEGWSRSENMLRLWLVNNDESKLGHARRSGLGSIAVGQDLLRVRAIRLRGANTPRC